MTPKFWRRVHRRLRYFSRRGLLRRQAAPIVRSVRAGDLSYLEEGALQDLFATVTAIEGAGGNEVFIEAGCGLGGSAIVIAAAKRPTRPFYVYDVFDMPPAPTDGDGPDVHARYRTVVSGRSTGIGGKPYYGYRRDVLGEVVANFERHHIDLATRNVHLVRGMVQDTLHVDWPVAFAHIDADRYESVKTCLERIAPHLSRGGRLVIDDYEVWSGCRKAVDEFFAGRAREFRFEWKARLHVVRR